MGEAVGRLADVAIVTNDNPRSEDPEAIAAAILPGLAGGRARVEVELDRRRAIERAIQDAAPGDVILIAGKGHEPYQIIGAITAPFDDRDEARRALALRRGKGGVLMATPLPTNQVAFTVGGDRARSRAASSPSTGRPRITSISTDTREIRGGACFVALRGEVHDGHAHLAAAAEKGAALALVDRDVPVPPGLAVVRVRDTLVALGDLARAHARRWRGPARAAGSSPSPARPGRPRRGSR